MVSAPSIDRILRTAAAAWRPIEQPPTPAWCEANLALPPETSADPGPLKFDSRPYWREPLAMLDDPEVLTISIMAGAQDGKSVLLKAGLLSRAKLAPAPAMLCTPDQDSMRGLRDECYAMAEESPALAHDIPPLNLRNDRYLDFGSMLCHLAYAGSKQRLRGKTCKYLFCTEVDVWRNPPGLGLTSKLIQARVKAFDEYKILYESTPTDDASVIAGFYKQSDQRKYLVPCPKCGHFQELRFFAHKTGAYAGRGCLAGLRDGRGNWLSIDQAIESAYYICERGCRWESFSKPAVVQEGIWVPRGQSIEKGRLVGEPLRSLRNVGYQISSLYSSKTFGEIAAAYLEHRESNQLRVFWNNWLGLPFSAGSKLPDWKSLGRKLQWSHRRGTIPAEAWFTTGAGDVQSDRVYRSVRAWGDRRTSWLVDWDCVSIDEAGPAGPDGVAPDIASFEPSVLEQEYPVAGVNPLGLTKMSVRVLGIDTNYRMFEIHQFLQGAIARHGDRVRAVRGDDAVDPRQLFRPTLVDRNARTGKVYEGGLVLWGLAVSAFKEQLVQLFGSQPGLPGSWMLPADIFQGGEDYLRQLVNQPLVEEVNPKTGKSTRRWKTRDRALGEHYWDLEQIHLAMAAMVTGGEWNAELWPRPHSDARPAAKPGRDMRAREFSGESFEAR